MTTAVIGKGVCLLAHSIVLATEQVNQYEKQRKLVLPEMYAEAKSRLVHYAYAFSMITESEPGSEQYKTLLQRAITEAEKGTAFKAAELANEVAAVFRRANF